MVGLTNQSRGAGDESYYHSGALKHRAMINAYSAIITTTPTTIRYSILFTSYLSLHRFCSASCGVLTHSGTGMAPAITSATMCFPARIQCNWNATGLASRRTNRYGDGTAL